jgi:hypothetical protein
MNDVVMSSDHDIVPSTPLEWLVTLAHMHWPIEQFYEDARRKYGLDRRWDGLAGSTYQL